MKKLFALLLALLLLMSCSPILAETAEAETPVFDSSVFKNLPGYEYDKFEDSWSYYRAYVEKYADASVIIGITVYGDEEGITLAPVLYVKILDIKGEPMYAIKSIDLLIDDTKYSYKSMLEGSDDASVVLGQEGKQLVEALAKCKSLSIKITTSRSSVKIDLDQTEVNKTLKKIAQELVKNKVWDYIDSASAGIFESLYPLTVK